MTKQDFIINIVCKFLGISVENVKYKCREPTHVKSRRVCIYYIKRFSSLTHARIGTIFGKDHSTVTNALQKIEIVIKNKPETYGILEELLTAKLRDERGKFDEDNALFISKLYTHDENKAVKIMIEGGSMHNVEIEETDDFIILKPKLNGN